MGGRVFLYYLCVIFILLVGFSFTAEGGEGDFFSKMKINPIKSNKKAPDFSLTDLNGKGVEIKQFKGKVIFLNFWATWCGPCKKEMPSLEILHQQFKGRNFVLLTISVDYEGIKPVQELIHKHQYTFPVLLDPKGETLDLFEVKGIPTTFLIDKKGKIVGRAIGPRDWKCAEVVSLLNLLIDKK
jgi:cytochrome c biogenesis protein CcmG/thiol:disulfide interchange protein DsbE